MQSDGKLVAAGGTDRSSGSNSDFAIARYSADGIPDSSFGNGSGKVTVELGGEDRAFGLIELPDRSLVLAGYSDAGGGARDFALARLDSNGNLHPEFNSTGKLKTDFAGGFDSGYALVLQPDNNLVAAGTGTTATGMRGFALARYNAIGQLDPTFGTGGKQIADPSPHSSAIAFALTQHDGKFVAAGIGFGSSQDFAVARFLATDRATGRRLSQASRSTRNLSPKAALRS